MNVENLAMVMGPTILGNSSNEPMAVMSEVGTPNITLEYRLNLVDLLNNTVESAFRDLVFLVAGRYLATSESDTDVGVL